MLSGGCAGRHKIQGIGAGFVPSLFKASIIDEIVRISDADAFEGMQRLAAREGISAGVSSGAAIHAALAYAARLEPRQRIVVMLPDTGERYLSLQHYYQF